MEKREKPKQRHPNLLSAFLYVISPYLFNLYLCNILQTTFSFPTSFTSSSMSSSLFPTLSSATQSGFSSTSTPAFSGFNFPSVNFSAGGSIFGAQPAKKEVWLLYGVIPYRCARERKMVKKAAMMPQM